MCTRSPETQPYPRPHQRKHGLQVKIGNTAPLLRSGETPPGVLLYKKGGNKLFSRTCCDRTMGSDFKLEGGRCRLGIRKKFFTMRVAKHWNRLPREVVYVPPLETFKVRMNGAQSNLV